MNERIDSLEKEATELLQENGLEWNDNFTSPNDFSPDWDFFGQEDKSKRFNLIIGQMAALFEVKHLASPKLSFTEKYNKLKNEVIDKYNDLKVVGVDFVEIALTEYELSQQKEIRAIFATKNLNDLSDYDFQEFLPTVYYNDRRGEEVQGYALSVSQDKGIHIMNSEDYAKVFYMGFNDINSLWSQIELLDCMD